MEEFLFIFLNLFNAKPNKIKCKNGVASGELIWLDDDENDYFEWDCQFSNEEYIGMIYLLKLLKENQLINGDKILKSKDELLDFLDSESEQSLNSLNNLENIKIYFIEDGERTDRLFLHY